MLVHEAIKFAMGFALKHLKTKTGDTLDTAIDLITPIFVGMFANAITKGSFQIPADVRREYELKALRVLQEAGIIEEF